VRLSESFRAVGIPTHSRSGRRLGRMFMHSPRLARTRASAADKVERHGHGGPWWPLSAEASVATRPGLAIAGAEIDCRRHLRQPGPRSGSTRPGRALFGGPAIQLRQVVILDGGGRRLGHQVVGRPHFKSGRAGMHAVSSRCWGGRPCIGDPACIWQESGRSVSVRGHADGTRVVRPALEPAELAAGALRRPGAIRDRRRRPALGRAGEQIDVVSNQYGVAAGARIRQRNGRGGR